MGTDVKAVMEGLVKAMGEGDVSVKDVEQAVSVIMEVMTKSKEKSNEVIKKVREKEEKLRAWEVRLQERETQLDDREEDMKRATTALLEGEDSLRSMREKKIETQTELFAPEVIRPQARNLDTPKHELQPRISPMVKIGSTRKPRTPLKRSPSAASIGGVGLLEQTHTLMRSNSRSKNLRGKVEKYTRDNSLTRTPSSRTPSQRVNRRICDSPIDGFDLSLRSSRRGKAAHRSTTASPITPVTFRR
eukprot:TRINITY_DN1807_c0_g1_i2.p1 TRINITY_DN1807_c0_g1~~TRINITY_DN1807_c0_g1_i2.p1  ORF type:complete len:246 (+),score=50.74 TRINITY_DN1807_c0_g1_i2:57-794(+)